MSTNLFTYEAASAQDLIARCQALTLKGMSGQWSFRGQADSAWRLVPSLLRDPPRGISPANFEYALLADLRTVLKDRTTFPQHMLEDDDFLLAFAQHYRVPTRLSDWTLDPLVALYFAASDALREVQLKGRSGGKLSVFAMAEIYLDVGSAASKGKFVYPPRAGNPNITAQRGHLLKHVWETPDLLTGTVERAVEDPVANVSALIDSRFIRLDLDWRQAHEVVQQLNRTGLRADLVYPSEDGFPRYAVDLILCGQAAAGLV